MILAHRRAWREAEALAAAQAVLDAQPTAREASKPAQQSQQRADRTQR